MSLTDDIIISIHLYIYPCQGYRPCIQLSGAMDSCKLRISLTLHLLFSTVPSIQAAPAKSNFFREYVGAEGKNVKFSDVPINPKIDVHFILSFAIDYASSSSPTNGFFKIFWDTENLTPSHVSCIKAHHSNVKVALSLGWDTIGSQHVYFKPKSINSWVSNAIQSITQDSRRVQLGWNWHWLWTLRCRSRHICRVHWSAPIILKIK